MLSVSPRDRIERIEGRPLNLELTREQADAIEKSIEEHGELSAIVDSVEGVATYPSLVAYQSEYREVVETVAHEWVHHYLFFKPLGRRYGDSAELRTLNETVANMVAKEIAQVVVGAYPLDGFAAPDEAGARRIEGIRERGASPAPC